MRKKIVYGVVVGTTLSVGCVWADNPTERKWIAETGDVSAASSWQNGTRPAQGTDTAAGEMAFFTGAGDTSVTFPAGGWTDRGVYYFAKDLDNGSTLTFDARGTSWLMDAGRYFSTWQIFTLCGGACGGVSYPHILETSIKGSSPVAANPIFKLTDGVVKLVKDETSGNVLSLESGEWNFRDSNGVVTDQNKLLCFNAEGSAAEDAIVLRSGSTLKAPLVSLAPGPAIPSARFLIEGGSHTLDQVEIGVAKGTATTPVTMEVKGGTLVADKVIVGNRGTTKANNLTVSGSAKVTVGALTVGNVSAGGGSVVVSNTASLVVKDFKVCGNGSQTLNDLTTELKLADDADVTVSGWFYPNVGTGARNRSETTVGDRAHVHLTATTDTGTAAGAGALYMGGSTGGDSTCLTRVSVTDQAVVETAARTTIGHTSSSSNILEVSGSATFRNSNDSGIILGRGAGGRGYLVVKDAAQVKLTKGGLALSGNLKYGDNLGGEERVDILGGSVEAAGGLSLSGTNAWVELAGGTTSFKTWTVTGEPQYRITDPDWTLPTNTVRITGGVHTISGYSSDAGGISLKVGATNGNARVLIEGGELKASSMVQIGHVAATGAPGLLTITGGRFTIAQKDGSATGDSQLMVGWQDNSKGRVELLGGELVVNNLRGRSVGTSEFIADGGRLTVLNVVADKAAIYDLGRAELGAEGFDVSVPAGLCATNAQAYADLEGAAGLFVKSGKGTLVTTKESSHARTRVAAGRFRLASSVKTFGRALEIADGAYVLVDVPAAVGSYDVLRLDAPMAAADLARIVPATWGDGLAYTRTQTTANGTTTVTCTVAEGGPASREISETTVFEAPQTLAGTLSVTASGVEATFNESVEIVGTTLVIDVPAGSRVVFKAPVASAYTAVVKRGAGEVVFEVDCPGFQGTWTQEGGVFDLATSAFAPAAGGFDLTADTLRYSGTADGVLDAPVQIAGGTSQKRVVVDAAADLVLAGGLNSLGGGLVKTGAGTLTLEQPAGTFSLNTGSVAAMDGPVTTLPENGASPADASVVQNGSTAGAGLQILSGRVRVRGAGKTVTTVKNEQAIYVGTGFAGQTAEAGLEISDCSYVADGTTRSTVIGRNASSTSFDHPYLSVTDASYRNHRFLLGNASSTQPVYPTVAMTNVTVTTESGFQIGQPNDKVHPVLRLCNTQVTQFRAGYATGHVLHRDFDVELSSNSRLNATWPPQATDNWHGLQFANGAWGVLKVTGGSTLQTSRIETLNTGATAEKHVDIVFDDGILDMTKDASSIGARTAFVQPAYQGFTADGEGMEVRLAEGVAHTFATPFRGNGRITKTGLGTMTLETVADGLPVFRGTGDVVVKEGVIDLGEQTETNVCFVGAGGTVQNGACAVKRVVGEGELLTLVGTVSVPRIVIDAGETELAANQEIVVARVAADAAVSVAGCKVVTTEPSLRGTASVKNGQVVVQLESRKRFLIIFR